MSRRLTTEEFIKKAQTIHGDTYDYSKVNYIDSHSKVCIICHKKDKNMNFQNYFIKPNWAF